MTRGSEKNLTPLPIKPGLHSWRGNRKEKRTGKICTICKCESQPLHFPDILNENFMHRKYRVVAIGQDFLYL